MSERQWTPEEISREWDRRSVGKYGNELRGESLAFMADVLTREPPKLDVTAWFAKVRYKPGVSFEAWFDHRHQTWVAEIRRPAPDRDTGEDRLQAWRQVLPPRVTVLRGEEGERYLTNWLRGFIHDLELHEADEWLVIDGERPFDPHAKERA